MFVQFISPGQFVAPFSLRLYVQDVGRADAFDKCALPKTNGYDNSTIWSMTGSLGSGIAYHELSNCRIRLPLFMVSWVSLGRADFRDGSLRFVARGG